jgi:hypothetical protein
VRKLLNVFLFGAVVVASLAIAGTPIVNGSNYTSSGAVTSLSIDAGTISSDGASIAVYFQSKGAAPGLSGTSPTFIGSRSSDLGAVWLGLSQANISSGNFTIGGDSGGNTYFNTSATMYFSLNLGFQSTFDGTKFSAPVFHATDTKGAGSCTLNGGTPATCTATVTAGATCVCGAKGTTAASAIPAAASLSSTTLTCTAANGANTDVNYICL